LQISVYQLVFVNTLSTMSAQLLEKLTSLGKDLGYTGVDLS